MSTSNSAIFSGTSRYTNDFQQVINRSVAIASLPVTQLTNQKNALTDRASAVTSLQQKFSALDTAIKNLSNSTGLSSLSASVSDSSIAKLTIAEGAVPANYTLEVQSLGNYTNTLSSSAQTRVSNPATQALSSASSFLVSIDGVQTRINPASNTLNSLVSTLNDTPGLNVQASLVNVGSSSAPDYRLSVQSSKLGAVAIQINDGSSDLLTTLTTGSVASYKINGLSTPIQSDSRTVTLAPGVSATLTGQSATDTPTTVAVTRQAGSISNSLSSFVNAYNGAATELDQHRGKNGGALTGNSLILDLGNRLRNLGGYASGTGQISSLAALGVTFDGKGHLTFDSAAFANATANGTAPLTTFLGGSTAGGFLKSATELLSAIDDTSSGILATNAKSLADSITTQQNLIDTNQARVDQLKTNLQALLAKSDAQVAALEQSYAVISGIYQAQQYNNKNQ